MPTISRASAQRTTGSEKAILDAAVNLYATHGPDGISLRHVSQSVGLTHALVLRHFGSKKGLVEAVERQLIAEVVLILDTVDVTHSESFTTLLSWARERPIMARYIVRSGLGDFDGSAILDEITKRCRPHLRGDRRRQLCGYAAASLVLGWLAWDTFLESALELPHALDTHDEAIAAAAAAVLGLSTHNELRLEPRSIRVSPSGAGETLGLSARDALLRAAIDLFAENGPSSVSIRDVARRAGVNHGLVHRHFGSKDALLAEAIDVGSFSLVPVAHAAEGFDIDGVVAAMLQGSPSPRTIARILVDDIAIARVRQQYPVLQGLLRLVETLPATRRLAALGDPRLASASATSLVVGSAIWGRELREAFGLSDDEGIESAIADLSRWLVGATVTAP